MFFEEAANYYQRTNKTVEDVLIQGLSLYEGELNKILALSDVTITNRSQRLFCQNTLELIDILKKQLLVGKIELMVVDK